MPPQLGGGLGQPVEVGAGQHTQPFRGGQLGVAAHQGIGDHGLDVFLEGVLGVAGILQHGVLGHEGPQLIGGGVERPRLRVGGVPLAAQDGTDHLRAEADQLAAVIEHRVAAGVHGLELGMDLGGNGVQVIHCRCLHRKYLPGPPRRSGG